MRIKFNKKIKDFLELNKIYTKTNNEVRFKDNDILIVDEKASAEPYSSFLTGNNFYEVGAFSYSWSILPLQIKIGRYCSIGPGVKFYTNAHFMDLISTSSFTYDKNFSIFKDSKTFYNNNEFDTIEPTQFPNTSIGNDVWIGADVTIRAGVTIGHGAVIGVKSLVTKDVPPYAVMGGGTSKSD